MTWRPIAPHLFVLLWCGLVAAGIAAAARSATEPPVWDALSYVQKAYTFWQAVHAGHLFNPFNLPVTLRPPGTVLMAYPFGWSDDFHWFYFRSCVIPLLMFVAAVYGAGARRSMTTGEHFMLASLALCLGGMPTLFQFQINDNRPGLVYWGLVDGFLAGVCALATAAAVRAARARSMAWSLAAAALGAFSLWVKPSGLLLMVLVGGSWLLLTGFSVDWERSAWRDKAFRRFAAVSMLAAAVVFAAATLLARFSDYFSDENIAFGQRVLVFFKTEYLSVLNPEVFMLLVRNCMGFAMPLVMVAGLVVAFNRRMPGFGFAALLCLAAGAWFWLVETEPTQIRYMLPFMVMAYVLGTPPLMVWARTAAPVRVASVALLAAAPTLAITVMLLLPRTPEAWQDALGINLHTTDFQGENRQAADVLGQLTAAHTANATAYFSDISTPLRNIEAVWDYAAITAPGMPHIRSIVPMDWQRTTTLRADDLLHSDLLAVGNITDAAARARILARKDVPDFPALVQLFDAWASSLDEASGVSPIATAPQTRVRVLRITDHVRLDGALTDLESAYNLPAAYRDANPQRWWASDDLRLHGPFTAQDIDFQGSDGPWRHVQAVTVTAKDGGLKVTFWIETDRARQAEGPWYLFAHALDASGAIVGNAQVDMLPGQGPRPDRPVRTYSITYPRRPAGAVSIGFGFFTPAGKDLKFLTTDKDGANWDGRRFILPLPASQ